MALNGSADPHHQLNAFLSMRTSLDWLSELRRRIF